MIVLPYVNPQVELLTKPTVEKHVISLTHNARCTEYGSFKFTADPQPGNPEHIKIEPGWADQHIVTIEVPQLGNKKIQVNAKGADKFLQLWSEWEKYKVLDHVVTFNGAWVPRYKRNKTGGAENLSNHSWGTAMDINAQWNGLGDQPQAAGTKGSVLELVAVAESLGWAWGGWWHTPDAMHFELT